MRPLTLPVIAAVVLSGAVTTAQSRPEVFGVTPVKLSSDTLFDGSVLQEVRLTVSSRDWETLKAHYLEDTYYQADFRWRDQVVRNVGIKSRGSGSRSGTKPGLKVDFKRYVSGQTLLGLTSLVLRNNTQDPSNMNERLSMLLFQRMNFPAPREAYARLYVNDEYAGLYTVVEPIDKPFLKRTYGEDRGYLYSYDYPDGMAPFYFDDRGSDPAAYVPLPFKPETHESDPRPEFIEQWVRAANEPSTALFPSEIAEHMDVSLFIRHVAIENVLANNDGLAGDWGVNNDNFYRPADSSRFETIPWDQSESFKFGPTFGIFHNILDVPWRRANLLMLRMLAYPDFYHQYLDELFACALSVAERQAGATTGPGWLEREIDFEYAQIREAALADPVKPFSNEAFEQAVEDLRTFARDRSDFVFSAIAGSGGITLGRRTAEPVFVAPAGTRPGCGLLSAPREARISCGG